ncbi:MAG: calcium-binding protein [Candidatus Eremiobacterota bacterium]
MIEEATVDCYDEDEQLSGLFCALEEHLRLPFETTLLGMRVQVTAIQQSERDILAVCSRGRERQALSVLQLSLPDPPRGSEWIAAYRHWAGEG